MSFKNNNLENYEGAVTVLMGRWACIGALVEFSTRMNTGFARD